MEFNFEIPDEQIKKIVKDHSANLGRGNFHGLDNELQREVNKAIISSVSAPAIKKSIERRAAQLFDEAIDTKLNGLVKRKVKEAIKSLSIDIEFVATNYDNSLGYRDVIEDKSFSNAADAVEFVKSQTVDDNKWSIEVRDTINKPTGNKE